MQLQIYIIFEKLWHKMSFKQRLKSSYTLTRFEFSWKMIPDHDDTVSLSDSILSKILLNLLQT